MKRIIILTIAFWVNLQITNGQVSTQHINAYLWEYPLQQGLVLHQQLLEELIIEMEKIIESGDLFFRPLPNDFGDQADDSYFLYREPGRVLQTIALAYPYLQPAMQTTLRAMVHQLFANTIHQPWAIVSGQPWVHYLLPVDAGKQRKSFTPANIWGNPEHGRYRPTIQNIYSVWLYAYRTGDAASVQPYYNAIRIFYDNKIGGNDAGRFYGTMNAHIGMARLAQMFNDPNQVTVATTNLTNALNFGLQMNLVDTLARNGTAGWNGAYAFAYDSRAINWVNRNYIFHNISSEIGRYLNDYLQTQTEARHTYMINRFPLWWLREAPYFNRWTGDEAIGVPSNSFGTIVPLERWFRSVSAETLASYLVSSPVGIADSYWIEGLVYAIESNSVDIWADVRQTPFSIGYEPFNLTAKILLEGPFNGTNGMLTSLKTAELIPLAQPYNSSPWDYIGSESVAAIPSEVVDWVLVELRDAATAETATAATKLAGWPKAMFLKSDGSIVGLDGALPQIGNPVVNHNLYLVIRHRNHLDVMSTTPLVLSGNTYSYDFTDAITKAHGGAVGYKALGNGKYGMVAGDIDADGSVSVLDFSSWATAFGVFQSYDNADADLDGQVSVLDFTRWAVNFGVENPINGLLQIKYQSMIPR